MSRWLVGSSSSSTSRSAASARASEARVSCPPEKVSRLRSRSASRSPARVPSPSRGAPQIAAVGLQAACAPRSGRASPRRWRRRPSPAPDRQLASIASSSAQPRAGSRAGALSRSRGGRWSCSATRAPLRRQLPTVDRVSPASIRNSVVLPAPLRPATVSRSRRSSLNETPCSRGSPAMSLCRSDAINRARAADGRAPLRPLLR